MTDDSKYYEYYTSTTGIFTTIPRRALPRISGNTTQRWRKTSTIVCPPTVAARTPTVIRCTPNTTATILATRKHVRPCNRVARRTIFLVFWNDMGAHTVVYNSVQWHTDLFVSAVTHAVDQHGGAHSLYLSQERAHRTFSVFFFLPIRANKHSR